MFQLNSYSAKEQLRWIKTNLTGVRLKESVTVRHITSILAVLYALIFCIILPEKPFGINSPWDILICSGLLLLSLPFCKNKPAKKKLKFTPRVIRMCVTSTIVYGAVCALSVIFLGQWQLPVLCLWQVFSLFLPIIANIINKPIEKAVNNHYIKDAERIIDGLPELNVIGITGSFGKTSTKFFLQKLLSAKYNVLMTPESYNTTMGVVKTVRSSLNATYDIFLCEMGAKGVGEIKEICDIVHPRNSMITSIGMQHLETFHSLDNIIKTKFEIADCIKDGYVFLNMDNEYIRNHEINKNIVGYGLGQGQGKDYYADNITVTTKGTSFTVHTPDGSTKDFSTKLLGKHNVQNIVGAIAVSATMGVPLEQLMMPVRRLESVPHRMEIIDRGEVTIIDDAFNSNPAGAKAALDTLCLMEGLHILITPGMVELGEQEYELNKELGKQAAVCDFVVLVGERQAPPLREGLMEAGYPEEKIYVAKSLNDGLARVNNIKSGDKRKIVLLENDLPDNY